MRRYNLQSSNYWVYSYIRIVRNGMSVRIEFWCGYLERPLKGRERVERITLMCNLGKLVCNKGAWTELVGFGISGVELPGSITIVMYLNILRVTFFMRQIDTVYRWLYGIWYFPLQLNWLVRKDTTTFPLLDMFLFQIKLFSKFLWYLTIQFDLQTLKCSIVKWYENKSGNYEE
jgi:hypothetical protein